jgi:hypothetical protein
LEREFERMSLVAAQIKIVEAERRGFICNSTRPDVELVRQLIA